MRSSLFVMSVLLLGCQDTKQPPTTFTPPPKVTAPATPSKAPARPGALTAEELKPKIALPAGSRVAKDYEVIGPAVTLEVCFAAGDAMTNAEAINKALSEKGWQYLPVRQNQASPGAVVTARQRPYLLNVWLKEGDKRCAAGEKVHAMFFFSKNDASFGPR